MDMLTATNSVWRSTLILTFASCYIMWGMQYPYPYPRHLLLLPSYLFSLWFDETMGRGMWLMDGVTAIVFLAQWHPLIKPSNASLRPEFVHS